MPRNPSFKVKERYMPGICNQRTLAVHKERLPYLYDYFYILIRRA